MSRDKFLDQVLLAATIGIGGLGVNFLRDMNLQLGRMTVSIEQLNSKMGTIHLKVDDHETRLRTIELKPQQHFKQGR